MLRYRFLPGLAIVLAGLACSLTAAQTAGTADSRRPGSAYMSAATQAMQKDDALNPAMLWVKGGEALWQSPAGASNKSCASCHAAASSSMTGVAARYPAFDDKLNRAVNLGQRINQCRQTHQQAPALRPESDDLLSLESYVALQSRGMPITPPVDPRLASATRAGEARFMQRMGQLDLSCAQCHDANAGRLLGGSTIPEAHPAGYPIYRLEWQGMGSLQRRLRNCMTGVRAQPFAFDSQELVELELYLTARAKGMAMETPAVRP
ncbi:MAG: SoxAX cytochrome complex subunit [Polaromonas sp.]|nr:SoxAX cytochrome complex subunit [Polaromonas sp.]